MNVKLKQTALIFLTKTVFFTGRLKLLSVMSKRAFLHSISNQMSITFLITQENLYTIIFKNSSIVIFQYKQKNVNCLTLFNTVTT